MGLTAATKSRPFNIAQWTTYVVPDIDEKKWHAPQIPTRTPSPLVEAVRDKFAYIYQRVGAQRGANLLMEVFIDKAGFMHLLAAASSNFTLDPLNRPPPDKMTTVRNLTLEHTINDRKAFYYFYVSRIRVSATILLAPSALEARTTELLPEVDLQDARQFVSIDGDDCVVGLDPFVVGLSLQKTYETARDRYLSFTVPSQDNPDKECAARHQKKMLAEMISRIMDSDPAMKSALSTHFASGKEKEMRDLARDYSTIANSRITDYNLAAKALCFWMRGALIGLTEKAHLEHTDPDFADYIEIFATITHRIEESDPGKVFFTEVIQNPKHWMHDFVLPEATPTGDVAKSISKKALTIVTQWEKLTTVGLGISQKIPGSQWIVKTAGALERITQSKVIVDKAIKKVHVTVVKGQFTLTTVEVPTIRLAASPTDVRLAQKVAGVLELVNLALAIRAYVDASTGMERLEAAIFAFSSLVGLTAVTTSMFSGLLKQPLKTAGGVAHAMECVVYSAQAVDTWTKSDYNAAVGFGLSATGSLLMAWGALAVAFGASSAPTLVGIPVGIFGLMLLVAGSITVLFTKDDELETFVAHCFWGDKKGSGSAALPWAGGPLSELGNSLVRQNEALLNLVAGFTLEPRQDGRTLILRVFLGWTEPQTELHIKIVSHVLEFPNSTTRVERDITDEFIVNVGEQTIRRPGAQALAERPIRPRERTRLCRYQQPDSGAKRDRCRRLAIGQWRCVSRYVRNQSTVYPGYTRRLSPASVRICRAVSQRQNTSQQGCPDNNETMKRMMS